MSDQAYREVLSQLRADHARTGAAIRAIEQLLGESPDEEPVTQRRLRTGRTDGAKSAPQRPTVRSLPDGALSERHEEEIAQVLVALQRRTPMQPNELAHATKLPKPKVAKAVRALVGRGRVTVTGARRWMQVHLGKPRAAKEDL
jgi:hypothetical protein